MTDASLSITQSALEVFAQEYLNTLGASVREEGSQWHVRFPDHIDIPFTEDTELCITLRQHSKEKVDGPLLAPESEFTQQLLDVATSLSTIGYVSVTTDLIDEYRYPDWLTASDLNVTDASFTPYYDRTAVFVLVKIGVETVSEYQTQFLEAVAIDASSKQALPGLAETILYSFYDPKNVPSQIGSETTRDTAVSDVIDIEPFSEAIREGQQIAINRVQDDIAEIREAASRAAGAEFEEYRQLQKQRLSDLTDELASVRNRLEKVANTIDSSESHQKRVKALEKRDDLQSEEETLEQEQAEILQQKKNGFEEKRQEIYERHKLNIGTTPISSTIVSYERGEIEFQLEGKQSTDSIYVPYAAGIGTTEKVYCNQCQSELSASNPVALRNEVQCRSCYGD